MSKPLWNQVAGYDEKSPRVCCKASEKDPSCPCWGRLEPISEDEFSGTLKFSCVGHRTPRGYRAKPEKDLYKEAAKQAASLPTLEEDLANVWESTDREVDEPETIFLLRDLTREVGRLRASLQDIQNRQVTQNQTISDTQALVKSVLRAKE